ncbi:hypothetical protein [Enhygromyxa salina]|nr:hypothetical protein [Enhygromyxa salina]
MTTAIRALAAGVVSLALALAPIGAHAAPAGGDEDELAEDPSAQALDEARQLFDAGVTRYSAAEYGEAVSFWLEAYDLIPPSYENRQIKAELIYNVARAQQKWFEIDKDVQHLRQSREILRRYLGEVDELYGDQAVIEREKIDEQIAEIDEQIAAWEAEQARREAELAERMRPKFDEEADAREARRNKAMIGAGAGLTALGFGGVGLLVTGIVLAGGAQARVGELPLEADILAREAAISRGETGNALMITGSLVAGVFLAAGLPLLAVGGAAEKKRKARRAELSGIGVGVFRGGLGVSLGGRF